MNIGVVVIFDDINTLGAKFEAIVKEGFDTCQLVCWLPELFTKENADAVNALLEKTGVKISAFWCGWEGPAVWNFYDGHKTLGLLPEEYRDVRIKNLCDGCDFAKLLGVTDVATHMGFIPENPNAPEFKPFCDAIRVVAQRAEANGQYLLFETGQETPVVMLRCFEEIDMPNLGINLDTANLILYGKGNPVDALDVFGKYVRNLHAKDGFFPTNGHELGEEVRLGAGKADFEGVFTKLKALGYDSYVTIEREIEGDEQIEDIRYAKRYLESVISKVYEH